MFVFLLLPWKILRIFVGLAWDTPISRNMQFLRPFQNFMTKLC